MDHVVNDCPEACWLCVKYNLEIDGMVASGGTIPVITINGSNTFSHRMCLSGLNTCMIGVFRSSQSLSG